MAAISAVCSAVNAPFQPNIFAWKVPRWSKGRMYRGRPKPGVVVMVVSRGLLFIDSSSKGRCEAFSQVASIKLLEPDPDLIVVFARKVAVDELAVEAGRALFDEVGGL